jgi:hypothetical protein
MQIDLWPIERVVAYDRDPRQNDQAVDAVAATRKDFMGAFEIAFYRWKEGSTHKFFGPTNASDL